MPTQTTLAAPARPQSPRQFNLWKTNLPDPRPLTEYTAALTTVAGKDRLTITLSQPCVVRSPN